MKLKNIAKLTLLLTALLLMASCAKKEEAEEAVYTELELEKIVDLVALHGNYTEEVEVSDGKIGDIDGLLWAEYSEEGNQMRTFTLYADKYSISVEEISAYFFGSINLLGAGKDANMEDMTLLMNDLAKDVSEGEYLIDGHTFLLKKDGDIVSIEVDLREQDKSNTFSSRMETPSTELMPGPGSPSIEITEEDEGN